MSHRDENIDWVALGRLLRTQRETAGISVESAAQKLCLANKQILALEAGTATNFPGIQARLWCAERYAALLGADLDAAAPAAPPAPATPEAPVETLEAVLPLPVLTQIEGEEIASMPPPGLGLRKWGLLGLIFVLVIAVLLGQTYRAPSVAPSVVPALPKPVEEQAAPPVVAPPTEPAAPTVEPVAPPPPPIEEAKPEPPRKTVEVQGLEAHKPARSIYVQAPEGAVLIKQRQDQAPETLTLEKGVGQRVTVAADEQLRVTEGKNLGIFYQGRKISAQTIEAGVWLRFVPAR